MAESASFIRRSAAFSIDCLLLDLVGEIVTYPLTKKFDLNSDEVIEQFLSGSPEIERLMIYFLLYAGFLTALWGFYFIYFIGSTGQTPGKKYLGIKVVKADGTLMDYKAASKRFFGYGVSSFFLLGFFAALFDKNHQSWHDKMANTVVVR